MQLWEGRLTRRRTCPCCHPPSHALSPRATLAVFGDGVGGCCSKAELGKVQARQGEGASPSCRSGHSSAASQTLPLPPPPPLPPFPFSRPQPRISGAARVSSADAAEGPQASSGCNLGIKTSARKHSNGKNRQEATCVHMRIPGPGELPL